MGTSSWATDVNGMASAVPDELVSTTDSNAVVVIRAIEGSDMRLGDREREMRNVVKEKQICEVKKKENNAMRCVQEVKEREKENREERNERKETSVNNDEAR